MAKKHLTKKKSCLILFFEGISIEKVYSLYKHRCLIQPINEKTPDMTLHERIRSSYV